jgi:hypothetical protein
MSNEAASKLAHLRWKGTTPEQRTANAVAMNAAKRRSMTKKQISEQARAAANARWKRVKESGAQEVSKSGSRKVRKGSGKPGGGRRKK